MGMVRFEQVTKVFQQPGSNQEVVAVNQMNLEVKEKEFLVFVGPSGCGKTTSLRMIAGLERPTTGRIYIGGEDVTWLHPRARNIAMVFQDYALYPHMTVRENMAFGLRNLKYPQREIEQRVQSTARMLGLENLLGRTPKQLSGGQRQRVALGRAIVRNPSVFLLDEPLSNLDAKLRVQMRVELAELQRRIETTTVYVTHDQEEAMTLGHRIVVMHEGVIQQVASPAEVYRSPANLFVAGFIGSPSMNLIRGRIEVDGDDVRFVHPAFQLAVPPERRGALRPYNGRAVVLGIRPEHLRLDRDEDTQPEPLELSINVVELLGPQQLLYCHVGDDRMVAAVEGEARVSPQTKERFWIYGPGIHFFDGETENRI